MMLTPRTYPSRSQTTVGVGLPAITAHVRFTVSPPLTVRFGAGLISILGISFTEDSRFCCYIIIIVTIITRNTFNYLTNGNCRF